MTQQSAKDRWVENKYKSRLAMSRIYGLKTITGLIFELIYIEDGLFYIKKIEEDLHSKQLIPFKVNSTTDLIKIENCQYDNPEVKRLLWYIWLAMKYEEEG